AIAPPIVAPVVAPLAIPVGSRMAALVPPLPRLRPALALVILALVSLALVILALVPLTLPLLSLLVLGASSLPLASLAVAPGSVELPLLLLLSLHLCLSIIAVPATAALPLLLLRLLHRGLWASGEIATLPLLTARFELRLRLGHRLLLNARRFFALNALLTRLLTLFVRLRRCVLVIRIAPSTVRLRERRRSRRGRE